MACSSCSSRSIRGKGSYPSTNPDVVPDFTVLGPSATRIRSGNGQQYSIFSPLVKMRPPIGWSLWVSVKGHSHFIEGSSAQEVITNVISIYALNDITLPLDVAWFNANRVWVSTLSDNHLYATSQDLLAITKSLQDPLIWNPIEWNLIKNLVYDVNYEPDNVRVEMFRLFSVARDRITGCEVCYDELTQNHYTIEDQESMKQWVEDRYVNIVTANG